MSILVAAILGQMSSFEKVLPATMKSSHSVLKPMVRCREFYKPVTAILAMAGHLMLALGNRLAFFRWDGQGLTPTGRLETAFLITSALELPARVRPLVLYGDVVKGMGLARYSQDGKTDSLAQEDADTEVGLLLPHWHACYSSKLHQACSRRTQDRDPNLAQHLAELGNK